MAKSTPTPATENKLRTAQVRILKALSRSKGALNKHRINEAVADEFPTAAKFSQWMADPLGASTEEARQTAEKRSGYPSLLTLGYVRDREVEVDGRNETVYEITASGRKAFEKALAAATAKQKEAADKEKAKAATKKTKK